MGVICSVRREHHGQLSMLTLMHITAIEASLKQCYQGNQAQRYNGDSMYMYGTILCHKYNNMNHLFAFF
jgi:hypothetical protein